MPMSDLFTDTITILKQDGTRVDNVKASVQKQKIFVQGSDILIEIGDLVQRVLSNGGTDTYKVIDPCFYERHGGIKEHYQMEVKKLGVPEAKTAVHNITYNITGNNNRVNQNSNDNSVNIMNSSSEISKNIQDLKAEIQSLKLSEVQNIGANEIIQAIENQLQNGNPSKIVVSSLLSALPSTANIAAIISCILSLI